MGNPLTLFVKCPTPSWPASSRVLSLSTPWLIHKEQIIMVVSQSAFWRPILINKLAIENRLKYDQLGMLTKENCYSIYNQPPFWYEIHCGYKWTLGAGFVFHKNTLY